MRNKTICADCVYFKPDNSLPMYQLKCMYFTPTNHLINFITGEVSQTDFDLGDGKIVTYSGDVKYARCWDINNGNCKYFKMKEKTKSFFEKLKTLFSRGQK